MTPVRLSRIELVDVRSYARGILDLGPGVTVLIGPNGQGKTNLLEAVYRAATGGSYRVAGDGPLVRHGTEVGVIRAQLRADDGRRRTLELEIGPGRRRTKVDGQETRRGSEAFGVLRVVLFAPEDIAIVRGDPAERRRFLDDLLAQRRPSFVAAKLDYDRVLRQRNQLLKQARGLSLAARTAATSTLTAWTEQLITVGTQITAARMAAVTALAPAVNAAYRHLADRPESVGLTYRSSTGGQDPDPAPLAAAMRAGIAEVADAELQRGLSLVGPHRDDLEMTLGDLPARSHSSHGEAWSLGLALKLATEQVLSEVGDRPVVLLDDVFAELDERRRARLAEACSAFEQVLVTAAVEADVPLDGTRVDVVLRDGTSRLGVRSQGAA